MPVTICSTNIAVTPELLETVFGSPVNGTVPASFPAQAQVISPEAIAAALPDYYADAEQQPYIPSVADYDIFDWSLTKVRN